MTLKTLHVAPLQAGALDLDPQAVERPPIHNSQVRQYSHSLPLLRESARIKGDKAGVRKQRPHATVASPPSVRPRQRAAPAEC